MNSPVCPRSLLSKDRLDIAIKWRFFRHLIDGNDPDSERVYRWHIMARTGGREPGSWKRSADDYVTACRDLLASMRERGFDSASPIKIDDRGRQMNGAHRLACALALRIDVSVRLAERRKRGGPWGEPELIGYGIGRDDLSRVLADWDRLQ